MEHENKNTFYAVSPKYNRGSKEVCAEIAAQKLREVLENLKVLVSTGKLLQVKSHNYKHAWGDREVS